MLLRTQFGLRRHPAKTCMLSKGAAMAGGAAAAGAAMYAFCLRKCPNDGNFTVMGVDLGKISDRAKGGASSAANKLFGDPEGKEGKDAEGAKGAEGKKAASCPAPEESFDMNGKDCPEEGECLNDNKPYDTFKEAWKQCGEVDGCGIVMKNTDGKYYLRREEDPDKEDMPNAGMAYECKATEGKKEAKKEEMSKMDKKLIQVAESTCKLDCKLQSLMAMAAGAGLAAGAHSAMNKKALGPLDQWTAGPVLGVLSNQFQAGARLEYISME
eukprot:TRINITY_DN26116_c0_g1_i1.p1 TRINITY_DN26116_c0_g1~~TRINITY_DN26116_c0_g1_i1.p1  ORF type:complete len:303 (+),score=88.53 TRINITY_DN26116_c0_g1_i1:104-910(+)